MNNKLCGVKVRSFSPSNNEEMAFWQKSVRMVFAKECIELQHQAIGLMPTLVRKLTVDISTRCLLSTREDVEQYGRDKRSKRFKTR